MGYFNYSLSGNKRNTPPIENICSDIQVTYYGGWLYDQLLDTKMITEETSCATVHRIQV